MVFRKGISENLYTKKAMIDHRQLQLFLVSHADWTKSRGKIEPSHPCPRLKNRKPFPEALQNSSSHVSLVRMGHRSIPIPITDKGNEVTTTGFHCQDPLFGTGRTTYLCQGGQRDRPFLVSSPGSSSSEGNLSFYFPKGFMPRPLALLHTLSPAVSFIPMVLISTYMSRSPNLHLLL